jgi:hypothetical protein
MLYYSWVIPGIPLVLALALIFVRFLSRLSGATRFWFLLAAFLYLGGSIGFELIGGAYEELYGRKNLTYNMLATVEESLELAGLIIFIYALLAYLAANYGEVRLRFSGEGEQVASERRWRRQLAGSRGDKD